MCFYVGNDSGYHSLLITDKKLIRGVSRMKASEIPALIMQFGRRGSPYRCILLDGTWGIGKSYQVDKVIRERSYTVRVSLFGMSNTEDIMSQLSVELLNDPMRMAAKIKDMLADVELGKLSKIASAFNGLVSARTIVQKALERLDREQTDAVLIVFDDLERIAPEFDLERFLGTLEALLDANDALKILLIANLEALEDKHRPIFERYTEKIVERTYRVTELADIIAVFDQPAENTFAMSFMAKHGSHNLRTLIKASNFFHDVAMRVADLQAEISATAWFMESIRLTCYAITFEATEYLYKTRYQKKLDAIKENPKESKIYLQIIYENKVDDFQRCVGEYTSLDPVAGELVEGLAAYYDNWAFPSDVIEDAYLKYTGSKEKAKLLQSQDEIKNSLQRQAERIENSTYTSFLQFVLEADELLYWNEKLDLDHAEWLDMISVRLEQENSNWLQKQDQEFTLNMLFNNRVRSEGIQTLLINLDNRSQGIKMHLLIAEVNDLLSLGDYQGVTNAMIRLRRETDKRPDEECQKALLNLITKDEFCPSGSITEAQYRFCHTAYVIAQSPFMKDVLPDYSRVLQRWTEQHSDDKLLALRLQSFL